MRWDIPVPWQRSVQRQPCRSLGPISAHCADAVPRICAFTTSPGCPTNVSDGLWSAIVAGRLAEGVNRATNRKI